MPLPTLNRIKKKKDFELIFKKAKSLKNNLFIIRAANNSLGLVRLAVIVSNKVSKKAVVRNKIRRRAGEVIKIYLNQLKPGTDLIITALSSASKKNFIETQEAIRSSLIDLKILTADKK